MEYKRAMFCALEEEPLRRRLLEAGFTAPQLRAAGSGAYLWHQGSLRIESLRLDHGEVPWSAGAPGDAQPERIAGYVIEGDLVIDGNLVNGEQDFGPVLVVLGALSARNVACLLYTSPSPRDGLLSRMPSSV